MVVKTHKRSMRLNRNSSSKKRKMFKGKKTMKKVDQQKMNVEREIINMHQMKHYVEKEKKYYKNSHIDQNIHHKI